MSLNELICKMECQELIFQHARRLDEGAYADAKHAYTADAVMVVPTGEEMKIAEIPLEAMAKAGANLKPRIVTNLVVTVAGPDTAKAFAYVTLPRQLVAQGEWHYDLRRTDAGWRISRFKAIGLERVKGEMEELVRANAAR